MTHRMRLIRITKGMKAHFRREDVYEEHCRGKPTVGKATHIFCRYGTFAVIDLRPTVAINLATGEVVRIEVDGVAFGESSGEEQE